MDEISDVLHEIERLVHEMVCLGKILCAKYDCVAQRTIFHDINGIFIHNFRICKHIIKGRLLHV
jgi:hypothetical protein